MPDDRVSVVNAAPPASAAPSVNGLLLLLELHREARQAPTLEALRFLITNQTRRLVAYRQAGVVALSEGAARVEAVSNIAVLERNAPYVRWLEAVAAVVAKGPQAGRMHVLDPKALPAALSGEWGEWCAPQVLWCPLPAPGGGPATAALWLARDEPWSDGEGILLERLAEGYGHALWALGGGKRRVRRSRGALAAAVAAVLLGGALALPVPQSALAPAEVAARDPLIVAAPIEGVIERFHVEPNQSVEAGQPLFGFEQTVLRSRAEIARKALTSAEAELMTATQGAFADPQAKARIAQLRTQAELRRAELDYARDLLERVVVRAERAGLAVFADANEWIGRPVAVGERILTLADPAEAEVDVQLAVSDALVLHEGAPVRLFLNTDPLRPLEARLRHASYEPGMTAAGVLAYRVKATLEPGQAVPRIGLRGTAKIYGEPAPLALYLFRRPLAALRQAVGF